MTFRQEVSSWSSTSLPTLPSPTLSSPSPSISSKLTFPRPDHKPAIVTFLRHCGCPFAEKTFRSLRTAAEQYPHISFIAVSHSDRIATDHWLEALSGSGAVQVIVDQDREIYAKWGLGASGWSHVLSLGALWSVYKLGKAEAIWNRPTESGSRWQSAGSWAVDGEGIVRWGGPSARADEIPDFGQAISALENVTKTSGER